MAMSSAMTPAYLLYRFPVFYLSPRLWAETLESVLPTRAILVFYRPDALRRFLDQVSPESVHFSRFSHSIRVRALPRLEVRTQSFSRLGGSPSPHFFRTPNPLKSISDIGSHGNGRYRPPPEALECQSWWNTDRQVKFRISGYHKAQGKFWLTELWLRWTKKVIHGKEMVGGKFRRRKMRL